jgi:hypothetical protein
VMVIVMPEASFVFVTTSVKGRLCFVIIGNRRRAAKTSSWRLQSYLSLRTHTQ